MIEGTATWAEPGGLVQRQTYEALRDEILGQLEAALPVDAVILGLHGAMVAQGYDDCEGDLLERVRAHRRAGRGDRRRARSAQPSDAEARRGMPISWPISSNSRTPISTSAASMSSSLALAAARGEIKPVISTFDCRMIQVLPTSREPMRSFVDRIKALHGKDGVLSVSVIHGFMAADVPEMGTRILVVTDNDKAKGDALAERLGRELYALREKTAMTMLNTDDGIDAGAGRAHGKPGKPVVIADIWDNPGGGVAGDGTVVLRAMLERGIDNVGVATIWDPIAVTFCLAAGEGAVIDLRFGGKAGPLAGEPIDARVEVLKAVAEGWQSFGPSRVTLGPTALVRIEGTEVDIILNTNRTQTFEPDIFSNIGVDPLAQGYVADQVDQPFLRRLRADRGGDHLCLGAEFVSEQSGGDGLQEADAAGVATGGGSLEAANLPPRGGDARQGRGGREGSRRFPS